ncbi:MAG: N-formylglutamate amidohydrolase [Alphaproteobacteria bacterium]|nr:N-formylglutamate amidohydrolase [Alphaproteobacteria bacterium]
MDALIALPRGLDLLAHEIRMPRTQTIPMVVASPHSGAHYPAEFLSASRLDGRQIRRSEDSYVDEIVAGAPAAGAPLIRALFARAYVDVNREPFELDPSMFEDELPAYVKTRSPRISAGLGTLARVVASGLEIYARKLKFAEALARVDSVHRPYHAALDGLVAATAANFGCCLLVDAHSMPSAGGSFEWDGAGADIVLGDCHGGACAPTVIDVASTLLTGLGYSVALNEPYPGGYTTRHYGRPSDGVHALQIEINRGLYMDEATFERGPRLARLADDIGSLLRRLGALAADDLAGR